MKRSLAAIIWAWSAVTIVSTADVYKGTLGRYPILMQVNNNTGDGSYEGRYSYQGRLLSIPLAGKSLRRLCEPRPDQKEDTFVPAACFNGSITRGTFHGRWQTQDGKRTLPFRLEHLTADKKTNDYGEPYTDEEFYTDLIRKQIRFTPLKRTRTRHGIKLRACTEPVTRVVRSRVILPDRTVADTINRTLDDLHRTDVISSLECMDEGFIHKGFGIGKSSMREGEDLTVEYYRDPFLLISYSGSVDCGGAHPYNYYDHYLFELHTGATISLNDLFDFYTVKPDGEATITPGFRTVLEKHLIDERKECYEMAGHFEAYPAEKNRIVIYPVGLSHATFACATEPIAYLAFKEVAPLARPAAKTYFPMLK